MENEKKLVGLTQKEVTKQRESYGYNEISRKEGKTKLQILIDVVVDPIIMIMIVAMLISFISGFNHHDFIETYVIASLIIVNIVISFVQEVKTIQKLNALDAMNEDYAIVIREGQELEIRSRELVPDDIIKLKVGQICRADAQIITSNSLMVDEAFLTGESDEVSKNSGDFIYSNSSIKNGFAIAKVIATGKNTKIGQIAKEVDQVVEVKSQLELKIRNITKLLLKIAIITASLVFILASLNGMEFAERLEITISILIATVPEGLATVLTIVLTFMSQKMARNNALIKKVALLETLGEVSFVCSDKTGTITENKMTVSKYVEYEPELMELASATIDKESPTSRAIYNKLEGLESNVKKLDHIPFSSSLKKQVHLVQLNLKKYIVVIGAPDFLISDANSKLDALSVYANEGLRTILFTYKETKIDSLSELKDNDLVNLNPLALFGILDPPKESAIEAIKHLQSAGIKPVMITGDNLETARSIAMKTGIITDPEELAITGSQLNNMTDEQLDQIIGKIRVYARTQPEDKYRIVSHLQKQGEIVAMTGDGTNDSIALKQANVGIAMGINGTDISKESADLILLDDNFSTINVAIMSGRLIFDNLKKFMRQMLTSNSAHTGSILFALLFGLMSNTTEIVLPMTAVLILWVNIVSDAIPCLALGLDTAEDDIMERPPIDPDLQILTKSMIFEILLRGLTIGLFVYLAFTKSIANGDSVAYARTLGFVVLSFGQLIHIFDARSFKTIYLKNPLKNHYLLMAVGLSSALNLFIIYSPLNQIFGLSPVSFTDLMTAIVFGSLVTFIYSAIKLLVIKFGK